MSASAVKAGQAYVEIATRDGSLKRGLAAVQNMMKGFAARVNAMARASSGALSGFAGKIFNLQNALAGSFAVVGMTKLINDFAEAGSAVDDMANQTGMTAESLSALGYAAKMSGSSMEAVGKASITSGKLISAASQGNKAAIETLEKLGLTAEQLQGMTPEQQMLAFGEQLSKITDQSVRTSMAMKVFGKAGAELMPMFEGGADGAMGLMGEAADLGQIMSTESASSAAQLGDALDKLWGSFSAIQTVIGTALAPMVTWLADTITENITAITQWISQNRGLIVVAAQVAAGIALAGGALLAIAGTAAVVSAALTGLIAIAGAVGTAFSIMGAIIGAVLSPIGLLVVGVAALGAAILYYSGAGGAMIGWLGTKFNELTEFVMPVIEGIKTALMSGQFAAAGKVLFTTLEIAFRTGTQTLYGVWQDLGVGIQNTWTDVWGFVTDNFSGVILGISSLWDTITNSIAKSLLYLYSLFDSSVDYAEVAKTLDQDTKRRQDARKQAGFSSREDREAIKQQRIDQANSNKDSFAGRIDELKDSLQESLAEIKTEAAKQTEIAASDAPQLEDLTSKLPTLPDLNSAAKTATGEKATTVGGTFSGFAASLMGGSVSTFDRMLDESKKTNELLATVAANTEDMGSEMEFAS